MPAPAWLETAIESLAQGQPCVLVTVAAAEGSAPREPGSKMLVHPAGIAGSIGGGHLELKAIEQARSLLEAHEAAAPRVARYALGPSLGQCCGGKVALLLERLGPDALAWLARWREPQAGLLLATSLADGCKTIHDASDLPEPRLAGCAARLIERGETARLTEGEPAFLLERIGIAAEALYLFGAGHVGRALVHVLAPLPYDIHWFDGRPEMFPAGLPANVATEISAEPRHDAARAPAGAIFLVMTHNHALDFEICEQVLKRGDFSFLGLIGSASKRATFLRRLGQRGFSDAALARLTCPIGLPQVPGKQPAAIAVAVAGQLLAHSAALASQRRPAARRAVNARGTESA